ncbi:hypothetical protein ColTof4_01450 [Colletotrichum tofieldiae]|nr:hypothetical protein ColTof3_08705 [Colletotrichum tofieldiae]GKT69027.1 hypothetical protein ColTof4_01450 [Colletotrichum tofieldiae]
MGPRNTDASKLRSTEPPSARPQNVLTITALPLRSWPLRRPTSLGHPSRQPSTDTTSLSRAVDEETEAEALERQKKRDYARIKEQNIVATTAYKKIPRQYLDWLMARRDASRRRRMGAGRIERGREKDDSSDRQKPQDEKPQDEKPQDEKPEPGQ